MQKIPLTLLEALLAFAETKNVESAARRLALTQPALSKQLQRLEQFFVEPIFFLRGRRKDLTPFGQGVYRRVKEKLGDIQEAVAEEISLGALPHNAKVRIAARRGVLQRILTVPFPGALSFEEASHEEILEKVRSLRADLGITHAVPPSYELIAKPLFTETFQLMVPKNFSLRRPSLSSLGFLSKRPCLAYREQDELLAGFSRRYDLPELRPKRISADYEALAQMVNSGLGWAILPSYFSPKNSWVIPVAREILPRREFFVVFRPEYKNVLWFKNLVAEIQKCF